MTLVLDSGALIALERERVMWLLSESRTSDVVDAALVLHVRKGTTYPARRSTGHGGHSAA